MNLMTRLRIDKMVTIENFRPSFQNFMPKKKKSEFGERILFSLSQEEHSSPKYLADTRLVSAHWHSV